MEKETLRTLEYQKIKELLRDMAGSFMGKEKAEKLAPSRDFEEVSDKLEQTAEAAQIYTLASPPLGGIKDIRDLFRKVKLGAILDAAEISDVMNTMYAMRNIKKFFKDLDAEAPILKSWAHNIEILGQLERNLENAIDEHGNLRDDASVELKRIRREIRTSQARIKEHISSILHSQEYQKFFQDTIVTVRDDRYVVPIKQEYRQYFPGVVHDQSASGSTVFVEPMAVVNLNNDVKQLSLAEHREVQRILKLLSQQIEKNKGELLSNCEIMANIDFAFAKAKLAREMNATKPMLNNDGHTLLRQARHPLIPQDKVVPIDIELGGKNRMLLITGPNTGGKTVSMKTLGLMVCMAQSGLFLPAAMDSEIAVYQNVYADIGDEQSIEQSLSTFSAHMTHIVSILKKADRDDLLLLDELGAGTDPEEGAALAMSILEQLLSIGSTVVATTHYSELKTFAYTREGIENACVEFDVKTLKPTYRLLIGIPGASNAFAISSRLGLSDALILRARQLIKADHAQFEHVINELEKEKLIYEQMNADIRERQQRAEQMEAKAEAIRKELSEKKAKLLKQAKEQGAAIVRKARKESENIIKELKEQFNDQGIKKRQQTIQGARSRMEDIMDDVRPGLMIGKEYRKPVDIKSLEPGDIVYVPKLDQKGTVLEIKGKELSVQLGSMKMNLKATSCKFVSHAEKEKSKSSAQIQRKGAGSLSDIAMAEQSRNSGARNMLNKTANARTQVDIRGMMVDEGEVVVGKFLDDAVMAGLGEVLIIHGKGTGALRKGIQNYLKHHKNVLSYRFADITEGGAGATVVLLK